MHKYERFAVYFAPELESRLAHFGREWLGMDAETGFFGDAPTPYVESPRRYGFHATLKAPMFLSEEYTLPAFLNAVEGLADGLSPVEIGHLSVKKLDRFLALMPGDSGQAASAKLAWACVEELEEFRASLTKAEIEKRGNLQGVAAENLRKWGYPWVGDLFRFHMTLTSALSAGDQDVAMDLVNERAHSLLSEPVTIRSICVFGDPGPVRPFELLHRFPLKGQAPFQ